jgi:glucokinase
MSGMAPRFSVGIDVGGSKMLALVMTEAGEVIDQRQEATPTSSVAELTDAVAEAARALTAGREVTAIGIAAAGLVDARREKVVFAPHLPWRGAAVRSELAARTGLPVVLDNDANCAAVAEAAFGAAQHRSSALVITVGTGIGGALVVDGALWRGAHGMAGEFGHMRLVPDGRPCQCGGAGCWEQYCSGRVATELMEMATPAEAYGEVGRWLGRGVATLVSAFDPAVVVVGGGVAQAGDLLLEPARRMLAAEVVGGTLRGAPPLVPAALGAEAGAMGAARLALS